MRSVRSLKGGLQEIADMMNVSHLVFGQSQHHKPTFCLYNQVRRIGPQHQAGSDSLLTSAAFFKMRVNFFDNHLDDDYYKNFLYGFASAQSRVRYAGPDIGRPASSLPDRSGANSINVHNTSTPNDGMGMTTIGDGLFGPESGRPY